MKKQEILAKIKELEIASLNGIVDPLLAFKISQAVQRGLDLNTIKTIVLLRLDVAKAEGFVWPKEFVVLSEIGSTMSAETTLACLLELATSPVILEIEASMAMTQERAGTGLDVVNDGQPTTR